jgi:immune inhibitor A
MQKLVLGILGFLIILGCLIVLAGLFLFGNSAVAVVGHGITPTPLIITSVTPPPRVFAPLPHATSTPEASNPTLDELLKLDVPRNDPIQITERLKKKSGTFATPAAPTLHKVGDQTTFWVSREITGTYDLITATLRYVTPHSYFWVENGETVSDSSIKEAGDTFENQVYPTDRKYFGSEWTPGIDGDPHVYVLNTHFTQTVAGYYSSADEYPTFTNPFSNQHEMIYLNLLDERPGTDGYTAVIAHEFTHMIHWNENRHEGSWITEGFGDLAMKLNGYPQDVSGFVQNPDLQLDSWAASGAGQLPHYQASYLFLSYLLNRFGDAFIRDMIASGTHDIFTVQKALAENATGLNFDDVFADWTVANYLENPALGPRYGYLDHPLPFRSQTEFQNYPATDDGTVHQYGTEYVDLEPNGRDVTFTFSGATTVPVIPTSAHSGKAMWWGNRVDQSDTTLTRAFDLGGVNKATLKFWTWYDVESDFDYAYVEVSTDGGQTWNTLPGNTTTPRNPNGANYGNGLTCKSGSTCGDNAPPAQWIQEQMDLSPYAGKKILLRFEYITDAIYSGPGLAVDDISIPEINFSDDAEHGDNGWQAHGFARIDNTLPQRFIVQAIEFGANNQPPQIMSVPLDGSNHGTFTTSGLGRNISRVVIAISGDTPITWETAAFHFTIQ